MATSPANDIQLSTLAMVAKDMALAPASSPAIDLMDQTVAQVAVTDNPAPTGTSTGTGTPAMVVFGTPDANGTPSLKSDTYFPVYLTFPGNTPAGSTTTTTPTPLTDEQKRNRYIMIASIILVVMIEAIMLMVVRKPKNAA